MSRERPAFRIRLAHAAQSDLKAITRWTVERFGASQAETYAGILLDAIGRLMAGPDVPGVRKRDELGDGIYSLHAARIGRRARHFILFRVKSSDTERCIEILRVLHDAMELAQRLDDPDDSSE